MTMFIVLLQLFANRAEDQHFGSKGRAVEAFNQRLRLGKNGVCFTKWRYIMLKGYLMSSGSRVVCI